MILGLLIAVGIMGGCGGDEERDPTRTAPIGGDETPRGEATDGPDGGESTDGADGGGDLPGTQPTTIPSTGPDRPDATPTDRNAPVAPDER